MMIPSDSLNEIQYLLSCAYSLLLIGLSLSVEFADDPIHNTVSTDSHHKTPFRVGNPLGDEHFHLYIGITPFVIQSQLRELLVQMEYLKSSAEDFRQRSCDPTLK